MHATTACVTCSSMHFGGPLSTNHYHGRYSNCCTVPVCFGVRFNPGERDCHIQNKFQIALLWKTKAFLGWRPGELLNKLWCRKFTDSGYKLYPSAANFAKPDWKTSAWIHRVEEKPTLRILKVSAQRVEMSRGTLQATLHQQRTPACTCIHDARAVLTRVPVPLPRSCPTIADATSDFSLLVLTKLASLYLYLCFAHLVLAALSFLIYVWSDEAASLACELLSDSWVS